MRRAPLLLVLSLLSCDPAAFNNADSLDSGDVARDFPQNDLEGFHIIPDINGDGFGDFQNGVQVRFGGPDLGGLESSLAPPVDGPDFNGDGQADSVAADPSATDTFPRSGIVTVTYSVATPQQSTPNRWSVEQADAAFGSTFAWGDLNADGIDDLVVAAQGWDTGRPAAGALFVYLGAMQTGLPTQPSQVIENDSTASASPLYGAAMMTVDVTGDDYDDVIFGVSEAVAGQSYVLIPGTATGLDVQRLQRFGAYSGPGTTFEITSGGDLNGDGIDDIVTRTESLGTAWLGSDSPPGLDRSDADSWTLRRAIPDANNDGLAELVILSQRDAPYPERTIIWGGQTPMIDNADSVDIDIDVTSVGDVNGDGYPDYMGPDGIRAGAGHGPRFNRFTQVPGVDNTVLFLDIDHDGLLDQQVGTRVDLGNGSSVRFPGIHANVYWLGPEEDQYGRQSFYHDTGYSTDYILRGLSRYNITTAASQRRYGTYRFAIGDLNDDGVLEAVRGSLMVLEDDEWIETGLEPGLSTPFIDYNGDGTDDLVASRGIWLGGDIPTRATPDIAMPDNSFYYLPTHTGDLNGDGYPDFLEQRLQRAALSNPDGTLQRVHLPRLPILPAPRLRGAADLNGDGVDELVFTDGIRLTALALNADYTDYDIVIDEPLIGSPGIQAWDEDALVIGNQTFIDADGDGFWAHHDCDDNDGAIGTQRWYKDTDGDGFADVVDLPLWHCGELDGWTTQTGDCDDNDPLIGPDAVEFCDGIDNNCDGQVDVDVAGETLQYRDLDNDGDGGATEVGVPVCDGATGWSPLNGDCDDSDRDIGSNRSELCDGIDNNCDGQIDIGAFGTVRDGYRTGYPDRDDDGAHGGQPVSVCLTDFVTLLTPSSDDCDDTRADIYPGAPEQCDGVDNACDGIVDRNVDPSIGVAGYDDLDGDSHGGGPVLYVCPDLADDYFAEPTDCNDDDYSIRPGARELCDGVDQDCDDEIDEGPYVNDPNAIATGYIDDDGDGLAGNTQGAHCLPNDPSILYEEPTDCDDTNADILGEVLWYRDGDRDGFGDVTDTGTSCQDQTPNYVLNPADCNDAIAAVNPIAPEVCNLTDDDCNGIIDDNPVIGALSQGYPDRDGDGFHGGERISSCSVIDETLLPAADDCNDDSSTTFPGAVEVCNSVDDDCDGTIDGANAVDAPTWFLDADGDGYGITNVYQRTCTEPEQYTATPGDCDDTLDSVHPAASEIWYDGIDQDCDGNDTDQDGDGFPAAADCDDTNARISPAAQEVWYDGIDQNCDDNDDDFDRDGYGIDDDCDDTNGSRNPGATEVWYDTVDQNCDGNDLDQDGDGLLLIEDCDDEDASNTDSCSPGCSSAPGPFSLAWLTPLLLLGVRRRS